MKKGENLIETYKIQIVNCKDLNLKGFRLGSIFNNILKLTNKSLIFEVKSKKLIVPFKSILNYNIKKKGRYQAQEIITIKYTNLKGLQRQLELRAFEKGITSQEIYNSIHNMVMRFG